MPGDKISKVYQQASQHWDMGTEEDFRAHVSDTNVVNKIYDSLSVHYEMPEKEVFKSLFASNTASNSKPSVNVPAKEQNQPIPDSSKAAEKPIEVDNTEGLFSRIGNFASNLLKSSPRDGTDAKKTYPFYIPRGTKLGPRPIEYHDMENSKIFSQLEKQKQDAIRMNPKNKQFFNQ